MMSAEDAHRAFDATIHLSIAGWAVGMVWLRLGAKALIVGY